MLLLKLFSSLVPLSGFAIYFYKKNVQGFFIPVVVLSALIFVLYSFAIFDQLTLGWYSFSILGSALFIKNIRNVYADISKTRSFSNFALLLYLIPFLVILNSIPSNYQLSYWDEFADWGMSIKYMFFENRLYSFWQESYFNYGHYPPAQQLLQYYFLKYLGWSETYLIWVELTFLLLIQLSYFGTQRKNYTLGALMFCASLAIPAYFHFFYNNIYVDLFLALYFSSTFLFILISRDSIIENIIICLMLFVLIQIKQVALIFAFILLGCYFIKILISSCCITKDSLVFRPILLSKSTRHSSNSSFPMIFFISATCSVFLAYYSWTIFKRFNGVLSNKSESIPNLIKFFENPIADRLRDTTHLFIIRLSESSFAFGIKFYYIVFFLFLFGSFLALFLNKEKRATDFLMLLAISFGSIFYFLFVLLAYILFFSFEEGIVLSGFERYTAIYFIAWVMMLAGYIVQKCLISLLGKFVLVVTASLFLLIYPPHNFYTVISKIVVNDDVIQDRRKIDLLTNELQKLPNNSKIFFVAQSYGGFIHRVFQYSASPMHVSSGCHSFGERYHQEDADTCQTSFVNALKGYDYLALFYADTQFWSLNPTLFPPDSIGVERGIFKIEWSPDGVTPKFIQLH